MGGFYIIESSSDDYKKQIAELWRKHLPGTPIERFQWMMEGNPAGPTIWFLAIDKLSKEVVGTVSVMPKDIVVSGEVIRTGIVGDLMVSEKHRVFGPAIHLLRAATKSLPRCGFRLFYTIPNIDSEPLIKRVGFKNVGRIFYIGRFIHLGHYFEKDLGKFLGSFSGFLGGQLIRIVSRESYIQLKGYYEEVSEVDDQFDYLWERVKNRLSVLMGNHTSSYISWRFLKCPHSRFRILTYRKEDSSDLLGYLVFTIDNCKLDIYDLIGIDEVAVDMLIKKTIMIARAQKCNKVCCSLFPNHALAKTFKKYFFVDTKYLMNLYCYGEIEHFYNKSMLFAGDRNV